MSATRVSSLSQGPLPAANNVANLLLSAAQEHQTHGVLFASGNQPARLLTYPELFSEARRILTALQMRAGVPGTPVALLLEDTADFVPLFWACMLGGYVACPLLPIRNDPGRWEQHLAHVDRLLDKPLFISTGELRASLPASLNCVELDSLRGGQQSESIHPAHLDDPAILMLTSGSTGNAKAVELTHRNLLASMAGKTERQRLSATDVTLNWIAFDHVASLLECHMMPLYVGASQVHTDPATILTDPLNFLRLIDAHRVSVTFTPNFLLSQINSAVEAANDEGRPITLDLSCLRHIISGGEANVVETGRRFLALLAPHGLAANALWPAFGMTETCAGCVYSHEFPTLDDGHEFASVGLPVTALEMRIVDDDGQACPAEQPGELQVRGPMIFHRYRNNAEATRAAFTDDRWFRTGDLGRIESGRLTLVARSKDSIIVSGVNYFSHELEMKLQSLDGIAPSFVAAFPTRPAGADTEQLVVAFATTLPSEDEEGLLQLLVAVRNTTIVLWGFAPTILLPLPHSAFPKTSLGKIQRSLMRKRLEAGDYASDMQSIGRLMARRAGAYAAPHGQTEVDIARIFSQILGLDVSMLSASASFFDLGGTSLDILRLTRALEQRLGYKTDLPIVLQNPSVRQLAPYVCPSSSRPSRPYDPIVPLQASGTSAPLFCVHPGNGEILSFANLARHFSDRPFYALRAPGFNPGEKFFESFEELLETYTGAILARQPRGPFAIAGYSFGCSVAFEVAKELTSRGHEVKFLGCIDAIPRETTGTMNFNAASGLALVMDLITLEQFNELSNVLNCERPTDEVCKFVLQHASQERLAALSLDAERFSTWVRVGHAMETILYQRKNSGTVNSVTVFRGEGYLPRHQPEWSSTDKWRNALRRWDHFALQIRYVDVPGDHFSIMAPERAAGFHAVLISEIERAFGTR